MKEIITKETCLECGVCCVSLHDQPAYCDVTKEDEARLGKRFVRLHVIHASYVDRLAHAIDGNRITEGAIATKWRMQKSGPMKGAELCACVALRGVVLKKVACSVYTNRPRACRVAVKPGDRSCRWLRRRIREAIEREGSS